MAQNILTAIGLRTADNELGSTPSGGLRVAQNCVVDGDGVVGPRRGQYRLPGSELSLSARSLGLFGDSLIASYYDLPSWRLGYYDETAETFETYGAVINPPDTNAVTGPRMKFAYVQGCLYITTDKGIRRLDVLQNTPVLAGGPRNGQIVYSALDVPTTVGFLPDGSSVAYRLVFGVKDATGAVHLGPPSGRVVVDNDSGADRNVALNFWVPDATTLIAAKAFWQLYRTRTAASYVTSDAGVSVYVPPDDELFLVAEGYITDAVLGIGIAFTDTSPDDFLGAPLYTNADRAEGILQANDAPPVAYDITGFDGRMFYARTRRYPQLILQIVGVGAGEAGYTGIRLGDQLTVFDTVLTAATATSLPDRTFALVTSDPDPAVNIQITAQNIVNLVNVLGIGYAQLLSDLNSLEFVVPGRILFQSNNLNSAVWQASLTTKKFTINAGGMTRSGSTVTVTTTADHGLVAGDTVRIEPTGAVDTNYAAGTYLVDSATTNTFTVLSWAGTVTPSTQPYTERRLTPQPQFAWNPPPPATVFDVAIGGLVRATNVVTVTTSVAHNLSVGMQVFLEPVGAEDANFPAKSFAVATVPSTTTFTVAWTGSDAASETAYQSGARVPSDPSDWTNGLAWSKAQQPEAVPFPANYIRVGDNARDIQRIVPVGNYLFVFKEDGIFVLSPTGNAALPYRVDPLDPTVQVYGPDTVQAVRGRIYALTNKGVVAVTASGASVVSGDIDADLMQYFGPSIVQPTSPLKGFSFGVSHETDQLYSLWLPPLNADSANPATAPYDKIRAYVYAVPSGGDAGAWTNWELERNCGLVRFSDNSLFMAEAGVGFICKQRNTQTAIDFSDDTLDLVVVGWDAATNTLEVEDSAAVLPGDVVAQDTEYRVVTEVPDGTHIVVSGGTFQIGTFASGSVNLSATSAGPCGVSIMGHDVTVPYTGDADADALALYTAINADSTALSYVVTSGPNPPTGGIIPLAANIANYPGADGNAITLAAIGTGTTVSAATLAGGVTETATLYQAFPVDLEWRAVAPDPAVKRTTREIHLHSRLRQFYKATLGFSSDLVETEVTQDVYPAMAPDDSAPPDYEADPTTYYGRPVRPKKIRVGVPQDVADAAYLNVAFRIREAFALWTLNGFTPVAANVSEKGQR